MHMASLNNVADDFSELNDPSGLIFGVLITVLTSRGWRMQGNCEWCGHGNFFLAFHQNAPPILQIRGSVKSSDGKHLRLEVALEEPGNAYDVHSLTSTLQAIASVPVAA